MAVFTPGADFWLVAKKTLAYKVNCHCWRVDEFQYIYGMEEGEIVYLPTFRCKHCGCEPRIVESFLKQHEAWVR